ncbi:MAG: hypothetical protein ACR2G5_05090 [Pyrinomonadaceae bacterium]
MKSRTTAEMLGWRPRSVRERASDWVKTLGKEGDEQIAGDAVTQYRTVGGSQWILALKLHLKHHYSAKIDH